MKKLALLITTAAISAAACFPSFAGQWQQDNVGWWYDNGDSTYARDGWQWINGKCYYFDNAGYCLQGTTTPDGYTVDASGAWIVNGTLQTQDASAAVQTWSIGGLTVSAPDGFNPDSGSGSDGYMFISDNAMETMFVQGSDLGVDISTLSAADRAVMDAVMESTLTETIGQNYSSKTTVQLNTGSWVCYNYDSISIDGVNVQMKAYFRISGSNMQMVVFASYGGMTMDTNALMNACIH